MKFSPWLIALTATALSATASLAAEAAAPQGSGYATARSAGKGEATHHPGTAGKHGAGIAPHAVTPPGGRPAHGVRPGKDNAAQGVGPAMSGNSTGSPAAKSSNGAGLHGKDRGASAAAGRAGHGAQISGTGMAPKGVGPSTIGAAAKPHSVINGTAMGSK